MGVSGSGKSTVGRLLAQNLGYLFMDGDDFHSPQAKAKMAGGEPLTDEDRLPWLRLLHDNIAREPGNVVLACSCLKESYRELLQGKLGKEISFIYLQLPMADVKERLLGRKSHFFKAAMAESQFEALQEPTPEEQEKRKILTVDARQAPEKIVDLIASALAQ